jgi:hypothetical protein
MKTVDTKSCRCCGTDKWKWEISNVDMPWGEKTYLCHFCYEDKKGEPKPMKTETKHTTGPWQWHTHNRSEVLGSDSGMILACPSDVMPLPVDASLIAAAPEMLEALKVAAFQLWNHRAEYDTNDSSDRKVWRLINSAISKAEGEIK